eukprot:GHVN01026507.1.p1 GENE.GHVN01026507.1~~GHVN01026507.1.p1  ORF type:complete len:116 (-),score=6.89 GHVN01026507.1:12-359(-)
MHQCFVQPDLTKARQSHHQALLKQRNEYNPQHGENSCRVVGRPGSARLVLTTSISHSHKVLSHLHQQILSCLTPISHQFLVLPLGLQFLILLNQTLKRKAAGVDLTVNMLTQDWC